MIDKGATKPEVFVCWAHGDDAWEQTVTAFVKALNDSGRVCAEFDGSYRDKSGGDWPGRFEKVVESRSATVLIVYNERWGRASDCHDPLTHTPAGYESWLIRSDLASPRPGSREKYMVVLLDGFAQDRIRGSQYPLHRVVIPTIPSGQFDQLLAAIEHRAARHGQAGEDEAEPPDSPVARADLTPDPPFGPRGSPDTQRELTTYLYAELDHSVGAYAAANKHLERVIAALEGAQPGLERAARTVAKAALKLNEGLKSERYKLPEEPDNHRQPVPPSLMLTGQQKRLIDDFYAVAGIAMDPTASSPNLDVIRRAILLEREPSGEHMVRLQSRYLHRRRIAATVWKGARDQDEETFSQFASAGVDDERGGAATGDVLLCLAQAHIFLHTVEHNRSLPIGLLLARDRHNGTDGTDDDKALLLKSVVLNTFIYAICEAMPWIFANDEERALIQERPLAARNMMAPSTPTWIARQIELLSLYRRAHGYRLLGDHQRAYNDLRKLQRIGRVLRTRLEQSHDDGERPRKTSFLETLDALAEYRIGDLYRADHDYMQALVHLCRSHDRIETQTAFGWDATDKALIEISLRLGKGKAFFEIGAFKRSLKWFAKAWLSLLDLIPPSTSPTPSADDILRLPEQVLDRVRTVESSWRRKHLKELAEALSAVADEGTAIAPSRDRVFALIAHLDHVKHEAEIDKKALTALLRKASDEIVACCDDIPASHRVLAADILQRIGHVVMVLRLDEDNAPIERRYAERLLKRAAGLDEGNLLVRTGILRCELRAAVKPTSIDPMTLWTSGASDVDQAIRAGEHVMLDRLAEKAALKEMEPSRVAVARELGKHFMTHTDSINLRGAVQHLYLTRKRAELADRELAETPTGEPYLEFVCLRRFGCVTPFMPRPAAVSAVGGGYLIRACWPDAESENPEPPVVLNILVDPGEGVVNNLYSVGLGVDDIDMVVATHDHPDHVTALDALVSLRGERERIRGYTKAKSMMVILGNQSVQARYGFHNGKGEYTVQHIRDASYLMGDIARTHLSRQEGRRKDFAKGTRLTITPLTAHHKDHGGNPAAGFVLELGPNRAADPDADGNPDAATPAARFTIARRIAFMSDTGISAVTGDPGAAADGDPGDERRKWKEALSSDIVVAHVSDVPSDEIRRLADLTTPHEDHATSFDDCVVRLADQRREEAERLMHALSIAAQTRTAETLVPAPLLTRGDGERIEDREHLYLDGLLRVAELMLANANANANANEWDTSKQVLVIGEFREELGSFRGTIAREINESVFETRPDKSASERERSAWTEPRCVAVTADIGLRIRIGNEGQRNRVLCSTCSVNNDRLDVERFHAPERMHEVCVKGDHEAMYWTCGDHDPGQRKTGPVFVEQMGGYDPFSAGGRYHG